MPKYDLAFCMTGNKGEFPGVETIVFLAKLAPQAGRPMSERYKENLPSEYCDSRYHAWVLRGNDHYVVFQKLSRYFTPEDCRNTAEKIEKGESKENFHLSDLRRLAEEIEEALHKSFY